MPNCRTLRRRSSASISSALSSSIQQQAPRQDASRLRPASTLTGWLCFCCETDCPSLGSTRAVVLQLLVVVVEHLTLHTLRTGFPTHVAASCLGHRRFPAIYIPFCIRSGVPCFLAKHSRAAVLSSLVGIAQFTHGTSLTDAGHHVFVESITSETGTKRYGKLKLTLAKAPTGKGNLFGWGRTVSRSRQTVQKSEPRKFHVCSAYRDRLQRLVFSEPPAKRQASHF